MDSLDCHDLDSAREALAGKIFDQGVHYKILFAGRSHNGSTGLVSCLCRALRNLGHHVFELDPDKHRGLTDNPLGGPDECAPILLKPVDFDPFCARVKPQIVVLCAGGFTFEPEYAQQLKQQGIVLVGITLSDPDVFASVQPHAHVFDFHTTNARQALGMYQSAGVQNTLYFPFGIDRSVITQSNAPERYRKMTGASFRRIVSAHLYEHRWMSLLETMFNCSPDSTPWLDEARIQSIRDTLAQSRPRCKQVIVSGFYGASNLGDELILRSIEAELRASDAAVQITVAAEDPVAVERDHGLQAFPRKDLKQALHHARTAAAILIGGGGLWHDYSFAQSGGLAGIFQEPQLSMAGFASLPLMGRFFNTPCHVVGMGIGPITSLDALRMLSFVANLADTIQVRDQPSLALLTKAGVAHGKASVAPDLVYALTLPALQSGAAVVQPVLQLKAEGYTVVGINLRPWAHCDESELFARLKQALHLATQSIKLAIVTIPMQNTDNLTLSKFILTLGAEVKHIELKAPLSFEALLDVLMACDMLLSMRLHACLLAHRLRKPVIGLAYDPKVTNHFAQIDRSAFAQVLATPAANIADAISNALHEQGQLPIETHHKLLTLEASARAALNIAAQRIAALPCGSKVVELPKEIASIRGELQKLRSLASIHANKKVPVTLTEIVVSGSGFDATQIQSAVNGNAERIVLNLPTHQPQAGQSVVCQAILNMGEECAELNLLLETNYARQNFAGHIVIRLQLGEWLLSEDLTHEEGLIRLHLGVPAGQRNLPLRLELHTLKTVFESSAWPRATRLTLAINHDAIHTGRRNTAGYLLTSRGVVSGLSTM